MAIKLWMLICVTSMTNGSSENMTNSKRLFGSKMCAFLCRRTTGCSQFLFSDSTCVFNTTESSTEGGVICTLNSVLTQEITNMYEDGSQCCPKCYKIIHFRRPSPQCVALTYLSPSSTDGTTEHGRASPNLETTESGHDQEGIRQPNPAVQANLSYACRAGDLTKVKRILSEGKVYINFFRSWQMPAVMIAAMSGHKAVVEFLVNEGADLSLVDQLGNNILHLACMGGDWKTVKYLLSQSMLDINSKGQRNRTPLMFAILQRCHEVMELLVEEGADMSLVDAVGNNVLHCACIGDNLVAVRFLLARGLADIHARNQLAQTATDLAKDKGFGRISNLLASYM